ncbi:MAG TPA: S8 family serine peptidase, partial [Candidatus Limnocylindrales bacterium]|nr:S8 family serine peptidase [Candidatus Limnocylindrales bacterium]
MAGTSAAEQNDALAAAGAIDIDAIAALRMHAVDATTAAADALRGDARVAAVELDRSRAAEAAPDDPSYGDQWSLAKIGWDQAHDSIVPTGSAVVAVLDTGVDATHPDLDDNLVQGASFVVGSPWDADANGHGTAMAGIVAAETGNGVGVAGVGYAGVRVMPVTVLGSNGLGRDSDIIEGLVWATDHGADVALMAFSASGYSSALQAAIDYAWSRGVVVVAATGNDGSSVPAFPAGDRGVIGVSSTDQSDALSSSSNFGADTFLAAPGESIVTTATGGGVTTVSGTSAAAAAVAGAAGLVRATDPSLSAGAVVGRLARNADSAGTAEQTGNGRLNLFRALSDTETAAVAPAGAAPVGSGGPFVGPYAAAAGNFSISPTSQTVAAGSINDFSWTFTATNAANRQTTAFTIPPTWPAPQTTNAGNANFVAVNAGTCAASIASVAGRVVTIDQGPGTNTCGNTQTFTFRYENVTAPSPVSTTTYQFVADDGNDPTVVVEAAPANTAPTATNPTFSPVSPQTNDTLTASTTTADADGDSVSVAWTWKVTRGANTCVVKTDTSSSGSAGSRSVTLALSTTFSTSSCTGPTPPATINPSKGDVIIAEATPNDGTVNGTLAS